MHEKFTFTKTLDFKTTALLSYALGVSLSLMGPVFHYIGWIIAIASLIYGGVKHHFRPKLRLDKQSRHILSAFALLTAWSIIAYTFNSESFSQWARSSSVPIEFLGGMTLAAILLDENDKRETFLKIFVAVNAAMLLLWMPATLFRDGLLVTVPFRGITNPNIIGMYCTIIVPAFLCCSFWYYAKNTLIQIFLLTAPILLALFTFSSGTYLAVAYECLFIGFFAFKGKLLSKKLIFSISTLLIIYAITLTAEPNKEFIFDRIHAEVQQIMGIKDPQVITTRRAGIWHVTAAMIKDKPVFGCNLESFENCYRNNRNFYIAKGIIKEEDGTPLFPHSMYLAMAYDAGIPALCLFLLFLFLSLKKAITLLCFAGKGKRKTEIFLLVSVTLIFGQMLFGIGEDILRYRGEAAVIFFAFCGILISIRTDED